MFWNNEVLIVAEVAHRAVTGVRFQVSGRLYLPLNFTAMTAAFMGDEGSIVVALNHRNSTLFIGGL